MDKKMLIRAGIIVGIFVAILGLAYGCSIQQANKEKTPSISNPDDVYATIGGYEITNQILWDEMKGTEGYEYLVQYIDDLAVASYIELVTDEEVAAEIEYVTYQTRDQEIIAEIQADASLNLEFIEVFNNRLLASGLDPANEADRKTYVETSIAEFNYAMNYLLTAEGEQPLAISVDEVESYYNQSEFNDACVIPIRFNSAAEAVNVLNHFNLVPDFEGTIARYIGEGELADVEEDTVFISASTAEEGDVVNVEELTYENLFITFVELYNYMNPWEAPITELNPTVYCENVTERTTYNFKDMIDGRSVGNPLYDLAVYTFTTLDLEADEPVKFTADVQTFGGESMLLYKVSQEPSVPFEDLTDVEIDAAKVSMLDDIVTATVVNQVLDGIRTQEELVIYEPDMKLLRLINNGEVHDNGGSDELVAKYGDLKISADTLFNYMKEKTGMYYAIDIAKRRLVTYSDLYTEQYGNTHDYIDSDNEYLEGYFDRMVNYKSQYNGGAYIESGVDPSEVSWSEFLYVAFGADNENDVIERIYVYPTLIIPYINTTLVNYESAAPYIQNQYDDYFSIEASHLLIYVDFDNDFLPDDFSDYLAAFTPEELDAYNAVKNDFENIIDAKLEEDDMTYAKMVLEFNDSLLSDEDNVWAAVQAYGFRIKTEDSMIINHNSSVSLDVDFLADVMELIEAYGLIENADAETLYHPSLTTSDFGIHKIEAKKGTAFDTPSAKFEENDADNPIYSVGAENANDVPTKEQILLYAEIAFAAATGEVTDAKLPASVTAAIDTLYGSIMSQTFAVDTSTIASSGLNISILENLLRDNSIVFTEDNADMLLKIQQILDATYFSTFPEEYIKVSDLD